MAKPPRSMALNEANAPDSLPMGVRADETMTEPGMVVPPGLLDCGLEIGPARCYRAVT